MSNQDTKAAAETLAALYHNADKGSLEEQMIYVSRNLMPRLMAPMAPQMGISAETSTPVALLDNACGTGVFMDQVQQTLTKEVLEKSTFVCADNGDGMVSLSKRRAEMEGWVNTEVKKLDAMNTGLAENTFTHVGIGLALHIIPNPDAVLADCKRILKSGGIFGATTFHKANTFWIPDMRSAFKSFPFEAPFPNEVKMQMHDQGDWTTPEWIEEHLKEQGFADVQVKNDSRSYCMKSAEEYVMTFGIMLSWLMNTWWSEETRREHSVEEVRELIRKHLEDNPDMIAYILVDDLQPLLFDQLSPGGLVLGSVIRTSSMLHGATPKNPD
ncbi:hypothetical protein FZEAL_8348 [Fusarium zealandicum]|uniref:Methyltransferase type 11 domain-containing protein n=1 Tax=Fusarium zealandicum TaxID=1053134 RepID=A0A8H4UE01_9HYPO|nr:hypothetical protein FZEAL_8348 [Fusarium zealandicum]